MTTETTEALDVEHRLICRILTEPEDWMTVANAAINPEFFQNPKHRKVWKRISEFYAQYHEVPSIPVLRQDFPKETYRFIKVDESIEYLIDEIRESRKAALIEQTMAEVAELWEIGDYTAAERAMSAGNAAIHRAVPVADDMDLTKTADERLAYYLERQDTDDGMIGIPTGYKSLDKATSGLQDEQLVVFTGFAKHGKSTVTLDVARAVHLAGKVVLYVNFEMSNREQGERYDARRAGVSLTRLRNGTLDEKEWDRLERSVRTLAEMPNSFVLSADRSSTMTLSGIQAKVDQIRPDVVIVDGVYMMEDEQGEAKGSSQALTNITRGFKRMAQKNKIPIVITTQSLEWKAGKRGRLDRGSVGYSSSFIQDADVLIGVERSEDDPDIQTIKIMAARNCPPMDFYIRHDWDKGTVEELDYNPFESDGPDDDDEDGYGGY